MAKAHTLRSFWRDDLWWYQREMLHWQCGRRASWLQRVFCACACKSFQMRIPSLTIQRKERWGIITEGTALWMEKYRYHPDWDWNTTWRNFVAVDIWRVSKQLLHNTPKEWSERHLEDLQSWGKLGSPLWATPSILKKIWRYYICAAFKGTV